MFIRRFTDHFTQQNWLAVILDLGIVVIGVFLGLQVQAWNNHREERNQEHAFIDRLSIDFVEIQKQLNDCLALNKRGLEAIELVSEKVSKLETNQFNTSSDQKTSQALLQMTAGKMPAGRSATFVEMQSSAELGLLQNATLRQSLITYDQIAQLNRETWQTIRSELSQYLRPLYTHVNLQVLSSDGPKIILSHYDLPTMVKAPSFQAMMNGLKGSKVNDYELCERQLQAAKNVNSLL